MENIAYGGRRLRRSAAEKLHIVEETLYGGDSVSVIGRRNGLAPIWCIVDVD